MEYLMDIIAERIQAIAFMHNPSVVPEFICVPVWEEHPVYYSFDNAAGYFLPLEFQYF